MTRNDLTTRPTRAGASRVTVAALVLAAGAAGLAAGLHWNAAIRGALGLERPEQTAAAAAADSAPQGRLWTCGMHPQVIQDRPGTCPICGMALTPVEAAAATEQAPGGSLLVIDPTVVQNMGLRVARVAEAPLARRIRAAGILAEPEPARHDVNLRLGGWIERLHAGTEGMKIAAGDPLFDLYSPELQVAVEELIGARKMREAPAAGGQAEAIFAAAARKLELYGIAPEQVDRLAALDTAPRAVTFASPAGGYLVEKMVYAGSAVTAGDTVMRLSDASKLWLDIRVFEKDLPHVRVGQAVAAKVDGLPGRSFSGQVIFVHPRIDPVARTALARVEIDNPELALRHGMFATAHLEVEVAPRAIVVPREAIIDTGERQVAFVALDLGRFEPRTVVMGASGAEGMVQVLSGLAPGEQVVVSGQFLLDAESRMKEAIQRFLQQKALPLAGPEPEPGARDETSAGALAQVSVEWKRGAEEALAAYLEVARALGMPQESDAPVDVERLARAALALRGLAANAEQVALGGDLAEAAAAMQQRTIAEQRQLFAAASAAAIELAERSPRTGDLVPRLFIAHCPMVPARWLQETEKIANPYYATTMKACGEIERDVPIPGDGAAPSGREQHGDHR